MTDNKAFKQEVRQRMEATGEKFTAARREVLAARTGSLKRGGGIASAAAVGPPAVSARSLAGVLPVPKGQQREVLALPGEGHFVVLGTAGAGKTVMAIHRAAILANPRTSFGGPVLLLTFNRTLLAYLRYWRPANLEGVTFETYHKFATGYLASQGLMGFNWICQKPGVRTHYIAQAIELVRARTKAKAPFERGTRFFEEEIRFIDRHGLGPDAYLAAERWGRGGPLARELRPSVLEVREEYRRLRLGGGFRYDWDDVALAVSEALAADTDGRMYRHIVIDEGQDFSPQMLRSLAAAIQPGASLTFFGDMAQQIYGRQVSWRSAGLKVPHGVVRIQRNYRNTPEIAGLGLEIAKMPFFRDVPDMVEPDEFEPSGPPPALVRFSTRDDETKFVLETARAAAATGSVGVLMRRHQDEGRFNRAFAGGQYLNSSMTTWDPGPGISYGTVHAAKGYEFDTVIVVGVDDGAWPDPMKIRYDGQEAAEADDGRLLYVGVTRAKRELIMTHVGEPTSLLPENNGLWREETR